MFLLRIRSVELNMSGTFICMSYVRFGLLLVLRGGSTTEGCVGGGEGEVGGWDSDGQSIECQSNEAK